MEYNDKIRLLKLLKEMNTSLSFIYFAILLCCITGCCLFTASLYHEDKAKLEEKKFQHLIVIDKTSKVNK